MFKKILPFVLIIFVILNLCSCADRLKMSDFDDDFEKEIIRSPDSAGKLTGIKYIAKRLHIEEFVNIFYEEGLNEKYGEDFSVPQEGKFCTENGEVFKSKVGTCSIYDYGEFAKFCFTVRIFDRWGYFITEKVVIVTIDSKSISMLGNEDIIDYWHTMAVSISDFKSTS